MQRGVTESNTHRIKIPVFLSGNSANYFWHKTCQGLKLRLFFIAVFGERTLMCELIALNKHLLNLLVGNYLESSEIR